MSGPIRQPLADVAPVTPTLNDKAVTIQNNTVRTSSYTAIYNLFKTGFDSVYASIASISDKLSLTGGTMSGDIDMNSSQIKRLGEPSESTDAATKFYVDSQTGGSSTLDQVLTNGNVSQQDANIKTLGVYDESNTSYGTVSLNDGVFEIKNAGGGTIIRNEDASFRIHNFATINTNLVTSPKTFTFPDINGTFAMTSYVDTAANDAYVGAKSYADTQVAARQPIFNYEETRIGTTAVTLNDFPGGTVEFTQIVNKKSSQYFRINSNLIEATSKIIVTLVYDGAGYPMIASQRLALGRVDILVVNPDILTTGGTNTDVSIFIQYQIIG